MRYENLKDVPVMTVKTEGEDEAEIAEVQKKDMTIVAAGLPPFHSTGDYIEESRKRRIL